MGQKRRATAGDRLKKENLGAYILDARETALLERAAGVATTLERVEAQLADSDLLADGAAQLVKAQVDLAGRLQRLLEGLDLPDKGERLRKSSTSRLASKAAKIRWAREKAGG